MSEKLTVKQVQSLAVLAQGLIFMAGPSDERRRLEALHKRGLVEHLTTTIHDPIHGPTEQEVKGTFRISKAGREALQLLREEVAA